MGLVGFAHFQADNTVVHLYLKGCGSAWLFCFTCNRNDLVAYAVCTLSGFIITGKHIPGNGFIFGFTVVILESQPEGGTGNRNIIAQYYARRRILDRNLKSLFAYRNREARIDIDLRYPKDNFSLLSRCHPGTQAEIQISILYIQLSGVVILDNQFTLQIGYLNLVVPFRGNPE